MVLMRGTVLRLAISMAMMRGLLRRHVVHHMMRAIVLRQSLLREYGRVQGSSASTSATIASSDAARATMR